MKKGSKRTKREENLVLWRKWKVEGNLQAREELIKKNERLIFLFLARLSMPYFRRLGILKEDIIGELRLGLVKALQFSHLYPFFI